MIDGKDADFRDPLQEALLRTALLCSDAAISGDTEIGDPTETALVRLGETNGFDEDRVRNQLAPSGRDALRLRPEADVHGPQAGGWPDAGHQGRDGCAAGPLACSPGGEGREIERVNEELSKEGLRVLAFA